MPHFFYLSRATIAFFLLGLKYVRCSGLLGSTLSEDLLNDHGDSALGAAAPVDIRVIPASPNGGKI